MPRYIDADALIISLAKDRSALVNNHVPHGELRRIDEIIWKVVEATTVDAVPVVRGEWIHGCTDGAGTEFCYCSACGEDALKDKGGYTEFSRYCPNCGAKMEDKPCE